MVGTWANAVNQSLPFPPDSWLVHIYQHPPAYTVTVRWRGVEHLVPGTYVGTRSGYITV